MKHKINKLLKRFTIKNKRKRLHTVIHNKRNSLIKGLHDNKHIYF